MICLSIRAIRSRLRCAGSGELMLQLQIISGKQAGLLWEARRFPVQIGRAPQCDLCLEEDGVWAEHFQLNSDPEAGFSLTAQPGAAVMVNQSPVQSARLRNGDFITAGAVKIAFRLAPTRQRGLRLREWSVWTLIAGVSLGQIALIAWMLQLAAR
jgi:predicted component of type VI protein secretion system